MDTVAGGSQRRAKRDERRRNAVLRYLLQWGTSWNNAGQHIRRDTGNCHTDRLAFILGSGGGAGSAIQLLCTAQEQVERHDIVCRRIWFFDIVHLNHGQRRDVFEQLLFDE